jgi:hypothetical protein
MSRARMNRRAFLKGVGGVSLALPLMPSLACERTAVAGLSTSTTTRGLTTSGFPKRLVVVYKPNGFPADWLPAPGSSETNFNLAGSLMAPLQPYRDKLLLLRGLDLSVHDQGPGEPHQQGMAFLTGRPLNQGSQVGGDGSLAGWASGISVDQEIARHIGGANKFASRQFGVQSTMFGGTEVRTVMSYSGSDAPVPNETSPYVAFGSLFSELGADPFGLERLRARRHSVLDAVGRQYASLTPRLGEHDRRKLDQHLTAVREVERRLDNSGGQLGGACALPAQATPIDLGDPNNYGVIGNLHMDLIAMALACDLTRVVTLQWSASTNNRPYPFLQYNGAPLSGDEHLLGHAPDTDTDSWAKMRVINAWYVEQFKGLLDRLSAIPEGDGTLLDNTVVLFASEINRGNNHSHADVPFVLAGSAGGYFRTGRMLDLGGTVPHNNLLVSLLNAMGVAATTFGHPDFCTGPLTGLT